MIVIFESMKRMKYTKELLEEILQEGGAVALEEHEKYNQRMHIKFRCKCGKNTEKRFEMLNKYRVPYCEECSKKVSAQRVKETCMEKYGVSNASKTKDVIEKISNIFKEKYGIHPKQTKEVQENGNKRALRNMEDTQIKIL